MHDASLSHDTSKNDAISVTIDSPNTMRANELFKVVLELAVFRKVLPGGRIAVAARHVSDFGDAQTDDPCAENHIVVETSRTGVHWRVETQVGYRHPWNRGFDLVLEEGALEPGDRIRIKLGEPSGFRGQSFSEECFGLRIGIQSEAAGEWEVVPEEKAIGWTIVGNGPASLQVRVGNVNARDGRWPVSLKLEDAYGNPACVDQPIDVDLLLDDRVRVRQVTLRSGMQEIANVEVPTDGSWHTLTAVSSDARFFGRSNPFGPSLREGTYLYWGEIHCQSGLCDGTNSPEYLYKYAREAAGLDFASVSSHDMELTPREWEEIQEATREANQPGRFVTFLGYEWSGPVERGGDHNIYFLHDEGPLLSQGPVRTPTAWEPAHDCADGVRTLRETISALKALPMLVVPHCGGRIANLDYYDPDVMPVLEIHSCHRNYEQVAQEAMTRGIRLGFIGGSDDHRGSIGDSVPAARERFFSARAGLVAVYARELTRESLWEAIYARRVYATNGCRIALAFEANGVMMGGEIELSPGDEIEFCFETVVDGFFDRAELVRQTTILHIFRGHFRGQQNQIHRFTGTFTERALAGDTAYYLRVYQTDGGTAWSSPVWVRAAHARTR